ncbi:MAG TPA: hypothetical protein VK843_18685 [Planctomycetota bacterium]|nr:hypothetical protein [Planctomycetota bacterium]
MENDRQIKSSASVASWVPGACGIWVEYAVRDSTSTSEQVTPQVRSLILELDAAERVPGKRFIAWKWFVDSYLPGRIWKYSREETQETLQRLVAGGWLQTNKVENPKNPAFPTATLSISREHPEVRRLLELGGAAARFMPMEIRGEPLSESIIRDRR